MKTFLKLIILSLAITLFCNLLIIHLLPELFYSYDSKAYDYAVQKKVASEGEDEKIEEIVIVDIDNYSTDPKRLGKFIKWPYDNHAKLIEQISADTPKAIAFDLIFPPDPNPDKNDIFVDASKKSGKVFGALSFVNSNPDKFLRPDEVPPDGYDYKRDSYDVLSSHITNRRQYDIMDAPFPNLFNANKANGIVVFEPDADGIIRRVKPTLEYFGHQFPFLGMQMFIKTNNIKELDFSNPDTLKFINTDNQIVRNIPLDKSGQMRITYYGGMNKFRVLSYASVMDRKKSGLDKENFSFKDKYVLVGSSLTGLYDLRSTPVSKIFPGVGIHANVLKTILDENYTDRLTQLQLTLVIFLFVLITSVFVFYLRITYATTFIILLNFLLYVIVMMYFMDTNFWIQLVPIIFAIIFTTIFMYAYKYATEEKDKKMIRSAFSQFVTKAVVDELLADPAKLKLGGERKNCSVFFSDVAGFTTISEQLEPEELVKLLNLYLTQMTNVIFQNKGMIDKYIGDAIMAVYGAPVSTGNHAYQACKAAIEQQVKIDELQVELERQKLPRLIARMGINSGDMVVGNMGSDEYFNYTVMGDAVNLAARLEPANKQYDTLIMIGENTYQMVKEYIYSRPLDLMIVKGKTEPVKVYELYGLKEKPISNMEEKVLELYSTAYSRYLKREWNEALDLLNQALRLKPDDGPVKVYIDRCKHYMENEPDENWSGVYVMKTK